MYARKLIDQVLAGKKAATVVENFAVSDIPIARRYHETFKVGDKVKVGGKVGKIVDSTKVDYDPSGIRYEIEFDDGEVGTFYGDEIEGKAESRHPRNRRYRQEVEKLPDVLGMDLDDAADTVGDAVYNMTGDANAADDEEDEDTFDIPNDQLDEDDLSDIMSGDTFEPDRAPEESLRRHRYRKEDSSESKFKEGDEVIVTLTDEDVYGIIAPGSYDGIIDEIDDYGDNGFVYRVSVRNEDGYVGEFTVPESQISNKP